MDFTLRGERSDLANLHQLRVTPPLSETAMKELERRLSAIPTPSLAEKSASNFSVSYASIVRGTTLRTAEDEVTAQELSPSWL